MEVLDCAAFWRAHGPYVVRAGQVVNPPFFYPLYRWQDLHSFSPLPLILRKGSLDVNPEAEAILRHPRGVVSPPVPFIDRDIQRLGGPPDMTPAIRDRDVFVEAMAEAMQADWTEVEAANPGKVNVVLCGGRDSLNLLLLKSVNPVVAYSAEPNCPLVREFVARNGLDIPVHRLEDRDEPALRDREIVEACGLIDLQHWRWTAHLAKIAAEHGHRAVFWKGQLADAFLTDYWRSYTAHPSRTYGYLKRGYRKAARRWPALALPALDRAVLRDFRRSLWLRGASMQGSHMGFLRSITDCLFVSGYHGPRTARVWLSGDYPALTGEDMRPAIGARLAGRAVAYPGENPAPSPSAFRAGLRGMAPLEQALGRLGIAVVRPG
jgi:hypothetical protein